MSLAHTAVQLAVELEELAVALGDLWPEYI